MGYLLPRSVSGWHTTARSSLSLTWASSGQPRSEALERYLRAHLCIEDAPLFPARRLPDRALTKMDASHALRRAEEHAGVLKLDRGVWHPYRRLCAVERKGHPDVDGARAGGGRDLATMKRSYQQADAATVLKVVENAPRGHIADTPSCKSRRPSNFSFRQISQLDMTTPARGARCGAPSRIIRRSVQCTRYPRPTRRR